MLEARKSRISGLLQILNKADTHYRTDIQRFKGSNNIQHQNPNNQLKYQSKKFKERVKNQPPLIIIYIEIYDLII